MKIADVTSVAWQQMCVSSWQALAASPVSGGGWTCSDVGVVGVSVALRQTAGTSQLVFKKVDWPFFKAFH